MRKLFLIMFLALTSFSFAQEVISGDITTDMTLTSDKSYILSGFVRVQSPAKLTIDPGTIIYGENSSQGSLIIEPGAQLIADGTLTEPIIFTSEFAKPGSIQLPERGDWGGVILLGNAPINPAGGTASIEGPGDSYGGSDPNDNSGILRYVRIEYAGIAFSPNNEINGLTFGGVGSGTTIDYVQVSYANDDSYEWFGGTVNCKHLIAYRGIDDDFDTDYGFEGKLQFLLAVRDPQVADVVSGSNGFESDNDGSGSTRDPRTAPTWWNVTLVGPQPTTTSPYDPSYKRGMHLRRSSQNMINNALILGWPTGILVDGVQTTTDAQNNIMFVKNSIVAGSSKKALDTTSSNGTFDITTWFANNNSQVMATTAEVMLTSPFDINNPNAMPLPGSPALTGAGTPPDDGFFDPTATFIGAFGSIDWTFGWARFEPDSSSDLTDVEVTQTDLSVPKDFSLSQNYPNPFNPTTRINFSITKPGDVKLAVFNILGQEVATLVNDFKNAGTYEVNFDASNISSGVYIYRLEANSQIISKKMTLLK